MKKKLLNKLLAGMLAISLALPSAMIMPGMETVVQAAGNLSVTGVLGNDVNGVDFTDLEPNPQDGYYLVPNSNNVRLKFQVNSDKKSVSLTDNSIHYNWWNHYEEVKDIPFPTLNLEIPAYVDGYPVTQIGSDKIDYNVYHNHALQCLYLTGITIPDTALVLKDYLFYGNKSLTEINLPDSIMEIGEGCFFATGIKSIVVPKNLKKIKIGTFGTCENLTDVVLPEGLTEIGIESFGNCKKLVNINIPDSVQKIGSGAFRDCLSLKSIVIPDGVTKIEERTFVNCPSLASITIPASVTKIEAEAFTDTPSLKTINYKGTSDQWKKIDMTGGVKADLKSVVVTCSDGSKIVDGKVQNPPPSGDDEKPGDPGDENNGNPDDKDNDKDKDKDDDKDKNDGENKKATVKSVTLSADKYTYNGKAKKPSVTAVDSNGKKISSKYYTVSYKNNKNVGQATVTVKFKGNYSGTVKKTFIIKPARWMLFSL